MFNKLVFWLALGFLIYVLATSRFGGEDTVNPLSGTSSDETQVSQAEPSPSKKTSLLENVIKPVMEGKLPPELSQNLKDFILTEPKNVKDVEPGQGSTAICGSKVVVHYSLDGVSAKQDTRFEVGKHSVFPGLEWVVMGMKEKGVRKADLPIALAYNNMALAKDVKTVSQTLPIRVELLSSTPEVSFEPHMIQTFDKQFGTEDSARCLDTISIYYTVRTLEGEILADSKAANAKPLEVSIGQGRVPLGIEQALIGMQKGGERTAILFPEVMNRTSSANHIALLNEASYPKAPLIFEFKRLPN